MFKKIFAILLVVTMIGSLAACGNKEPETFSAMDMTQKRKFIANYMSETYNLDVGVTADVVKLPDSEYSYATARTPDGKQVHCWITEDKTVIDDQFLLDLEDDFNEIFETVVSESIKDFKLSCDVTLNAPPTDETKSMSAKDLVKLDGTTVVVNILITRESRSKINSIVAKKFNGDLDFVTGEVYVYVVSDLSSASFSGLNSSTCESSCKLTPPKTEETK